MKPLLALIPALLLSAQAFASQSNITEADGESCMGKDKSRNQTELAALEDAKRQALEFSRTYVESTTEIENFELKQDLVRAFARADIQVLSVIEEVWGEGDDCFTIRIKAEVIPIKEELDQVNQQAGLLDDPTAPLSVTVRADKNAYAAGENMKIYIRANKPFFARVIYTDASGENVQILPNAYRRDNYFTGGVWHEVPDGRDKFDLTVGDPFGQEKMTVYASTVQLGQLNTEAMGPVFEVKDEPMQIAAKTRGISVSDASETDVKVSGAQKVQKKKRLAEFAEDNIAVTTSAGGD